MQNQENDNCLFMAGSHQVSDLLSYVKNLEPVLSGRQKRGNTCSANFLKYREILPPQILNGLSMWQGQDRSAWVGHKFSVAVSENGAPCSHTQCGRLRVTSEQSPVLRREGDELENTTCLACIVWCSMLANHFRKSKIVNISGFAGHIVTYSTLQF